jgi:preprotein translocase subunit SecE
MAEKEFKETVKKANRSIIIVVIVVVVLILLTILLDEFISNK